MEKAQGLERRSERSEEGALIIEIMIGTVVIIVALSAIMSVVLSSAVMRRQNEEITLAYTAASNAMEELRTLPVEELVLRNNAGFDIMTLNGDAAGLRAVPGDTDGLPGQLTVTLDSSSGGNAIYHIVAQVNWVGAKGRQDLSLESLIGARAIQ